MQYKMSPIYKNIISLICFITVITTLGILMAFKQNPQHKFKYNTVHLEQRSITQSMQVNGIIESENVITIRSKIDGTLRHKNIKEGINITKGQVLATIYNPKILDEVLLNDNNLQLAKLNLSDTSRQLANGKKLFKLNSITNEAYRQLKMQDQKAKYELQRAEKNYQYSLNDKKELRITAPFSGKLLQVIENNGSSIVSGTKLFILANMDKLIAKMIIDENDVDKIYIGQEIILESESKKDCQSKSKIESISQLVDNVDMKGTLAIKSPFISINQNELALGSSIRGIVVQKTKKDIRTLPISSLWQENGIKYIYKYKNNLISKQEIETGIFDGTFIEIMTGVEPKDQIIVIQNYKELQNFYEEHIKL